MHNLILSLIVPVYNVEAYLTKCIDSLLDQDLSPIDYEIILVDDGSTDSSGHICDVFAARYGIIRVIHQQNRGLSAARNVGIAAAKGKYIQFVDSDDYLNPNVLKGILCQLEGHNLDILRINYQNVTPAGEVFEPNKYSKPFADYSEDVCDGITFLNERLGYACYAVQFVIKASLLKAEGNNFKEGIFFEDVEWAPRILVKARRVASSPCIVYNYLYRINSITRTTNLEQKRKKISDQLYIIDALHSQSKNANNVCWFKVMVSHISLSILLSISRSFYSERFVFIKELKNKKVFPLSTLHTTVEAKRKIKLMNISPYLGCWIFHIKTIL